VAEPAERMKSMRERRRAKGLREVRLVGPDPRDPAVRAQIAEQMKRLDPAAEEDSLRWIEAVSIFDETR
jgi:Protein  of unknown function (DUF3018)